MSRALAVLLYMHAVCVHVEARRKKALGELSATGLTERVGSPRRSNISAPDYAVPGEPLNGSSHTILMALQDQQPGKSYVGCYVDDADRMFDRGPQDNGYNMESCADQCRSIGDAYYGLQDGGWCSCGSLADIGSTAVYERKPDSECGTYGTKWRNAVYTVGPPVDLFESWMGCYVDDANRMFDRGPLDYGYTGETCAAECGSIGDAYFALQNGGWCCCGSEADIGSTAVYEPKPALACGAEEEKYGGYRGGGRWLNAVYRVPDAEVPDTTMRLEPFVPDTTRRLEPYVPDTTTRLENPVPDTTTRLANTVPDTTTRNRDRDRDEWWWNQNH